MAVKTQKLKKKKSSTLTKGAAKALQAMRKIHGAGTGRPRSVPHVAGLPIGSTQTDRSRGYPTYTCLCHECRVARGHAKNG